MFQKDVFLLNTDLKPKWGQTLFFKPCFSASAALRSFGTSTLATLPLKGSKLWEIMQFSSQSESAEHSAMDVGSRLSFLLQDPQTQKGFRRASEGVSKGVSEGVSEGSLKGF